MALTLIGLTSNLVMTSMTTSLDLVSATFSVGRLENLKESRYLLSPQARAFGFSVEQRPRSARDPETHGRCTLPKTELPQTFQSSPRCRSRKPRPSDSSIESGNHEWPGIFTQGGAVVGFWGLAIPEMSHRASSVD